VNDPLRRLAAFAALLLFGVVANLTWIQVVNADKYNDEPGNTRQLLAEYDRERGPITHARRDAVAISIETDAALRYLRTYPFGPSYAPITGYYSLVYGATGIERASNDILSGSDDRLLVDRVEQLLAGRKPQGGSVTLTVDPAVQRAAYQALNGRKGAVVAIEPSTGKILALATSPSYDPSLISQHDTDQVTAEYERLDADPDQPMLNRALAQVYPPGSTFKVVTAAAALSTGRYTPDTVIPAPKTVKLPDSTATIENFGGSTCSRSGRMTLADALRISCNTAFALLGQELGADALQAQAEAFGFNETFQVPMTSATSVFPDDIDPAQTMQSAIGQFDVRATPLSMAMVSAAVANDGVAMYPYLVDEELGPDLAVLDKTDPEEFRQAVTPEVAAQLREMMIGVVASGSGQAARISGVEVAGKTGTAQQGPGEPPHAWFTAFAPAGSPEVAVSVVIEDGGGSAEATGGRIAAPIAKAVIEAVL
jgi:peptidoglycan glycosyltransferase